MFGSSGTGHDSTFEDHRSSPTSSKPPSLSIPDSNSRSVSPGQDASHSPMAGRKSEDVSTDSGGEKRSRRSSGVAKVFSNAKQSFMAGSPTKEKQAPQTPIQKLSKTDPALSVPQGSNNNAAGNSVPGPHSTFRVGVTEDKNKKCRRTMEDTHAYLYNFLSTPAPHVDSPSTGHMSSSLTSGDTNQPSKLPIVETDNGYFAIFDGHAGTFAAEWCGKKLHLLLEENIRKFPNRPIPELLDETFTNVDQQLEKLPLKNSGCTAVIAVLRWEDRIPNSQSATGSTSIAPATAAVIARERSGSTDINDDVNVPNGPPELQVNVPAIEAKLRESASRQRVLYTANVGDARIVLCRNGKALRLSYDHKGSDDNEGKRIANAGGLILNNRVNGVLAVTRALGDTYMKDLVTGHPYTTETVIQPDIDEFIILACDGLWDVCSDQEAVDIVRRVNEPQVASKKLVDYALARFSTDNLSCMVVRFDTRAVSDTIAHRAEPIGVEGDPLSTVSGGISESDAIVGAARRSIDKLRAEGRLGPPDDIGDIAEEPAQSQTDQEPGPELNADVLKQAKEKAAQGQAEVGMRG